MMNDVSFEKLTENYQPLIKKEIKKLNMYNHYDELYQIGLIALWEAKTRFDPSKGFFASYAQKYVSGKLHTYLRKELKYQEQYLVNLEPELIETIPTNDVQEQSVFPAKKISKLLSEKEKVWFHEFYQNGKEPTAIAKENQVSVNTVKTWRKRAIEKIRANFNTSELLTMLDDIND